MSDQPVLTSFEPVIGRRPLVLVLGSMPGKASLNANHYYAHPRNAFWPIIEALPDYQRPGNDPGDDLGQLMATRYQQLGQLRIALWDVLAQCRREGSLDSNIDRNTARGNDFDTLFRRYPSIGHILFNGGTAESLFRRLVMPTLKAPELQFRRLPSTSPAMASLTLAQKTAQWHQALAAAGI